MINKQAILWRSAIAVALIAGLSGCWSRAGGRSVVVYCALDSEFSQPILAEFTRESGIEVAPKFDVESTKTVGLVNAILAEQSRPRCDVFWNNEILNTIRLQRRGLLAPFQPPEADEFPAEFQAADHTWHGFAARARVLLVNTQIVADAERPDSIYDLLDAKWRGKIGMAKPLFGTTATHAACLFASLGDDAAQEFFRQLKANNAQILSGNKQVAQGVASGQLAFGITDTDDAIIEVEQGQPVAIVYPDRRADQLGTLFIPNTVAILRGAPRPKEAQRLVRYLLSTSVEASLAQAESAQIPLNPQVTVAPRVETPRSVKAMPVDFEQAAECWDRAARFLRDEFTAG